MDPGPYVGPMMPLHERLSPLYNAGNSPGKGRAVVRIAAGLAVLLWLALAEAAGAQKRPHQDAVPEASGSLYVTQDELEQIQRQRADAMRRDLEIARDLERLPERRVIDRTGGPTTWRLWDTY